MSDTPRCATCPVSLPASVRLRIVPRRDVDPITEAARAQATCRRGHPISGLGRLHDLSQRLEAPAASGGGMKRRRFLMRIASAVATGSGLLAARAAPAIQRAVEQSPRYIWDPERQMMTERLKDGVYHVMRSGAP